MSNLHFRKPEDWYFAIITFVLKMNFKNFYKRKNIYYDFSDDMVTRGLNIENIQSGP